MNLTTPRLNLRPMRPGDLPALVALWTDPAVTRFLGGPREQVALRAGLAEDLLPDAPTFNLWPVLEVAGGRLVGHCGILDKVVDGRTESELVYVFAGSAWGQGYATEIGLALCDHAFGALGLTRLISLIEPENAASRRVAEKVGNALKRAFPGGRGGCVRIRLTSEGENIVLSVGDDGVGLPAGLDIRQTETLGLQLVQMLTEQLGGEVELRQEGGMEFTITFHQRAGVPRW